MFAHSCGEYVLDQLQRGVSPDDIVQVLLQEYLVKTHRFRLLAYRRFCEHRGDSWTLEHLERAHWEYHYQQTPLGEDNRFAGMSLHHNKLIGIHVSFCEHADIAEELVPLRVLRTFYLKHGEPAALPHQCPGATLVKDSLPAQLIEAYCKVLRGRTLPSLGSSCISTYGNLIGWQVSLLNL